MNRIPTRALCLVVFTILTSLLTTSCSPLSVEYYKGDSMGTYVTIQCVESKSARIQDIFTESEALLAEFESQLSNWKSDSWINRFNAAPANTPVPVPDYAYEVVDLCLTLARQSEGALDPTISPLIELWGFGTQRDTRIPDASEIQQALHSTGYDKLILDPSRRTLLKTQDNIQLNCSAVAKGYAVDLVAQLLEKNRITNFLVNIGGEISARGVNADGEPWRVGINRTYPTLTIPLHNQSLATSGHSQRSFVIDGTRYSHILNPNTGYPVPADTASVTIVAPTCALADGLATLALIVDPEKLDRIGSNYDGIENHRTPRSHK